MKLLNPRLDIVFKMLFVQKPHLLQKMLEAVLEQRIDGLQILNPELPGDLSTEKRIVLDIRAELSNRTRVDVEIQIRVTPEMRSRLVYYSAREYTKQLSRGELYDSLTPTVVVAWLEQPLFSGPPRLHRVSELRERDTGELFSEQLAIHVLQLSDFHPSGVGTNPADTEWQQALARWARFLLAKDQQELEQLATEDEIMAEAAQTLEDLSKDPQAARLAQEREESMKFYRIGLAMSRQEGVEAGLEEGHKEGVEVGRKEGVEVGLEKGRVAALQDSIRQFCGVFGIELTPGREAQLDASVGELERLQQRLFTERSWPQDE